MLQMPRVGQQCGQRTCQHGSLLWTASTTFGEQRRSNSNARDAFQKTSNLLFKREPRALPKFRYWRRRIANRWANQYQPGRVEVMGPDFACMEWLMNAGATSVLLSDGTTIGRRKEMSQFLASQGFNLNKLDLEAPETLLLNRTWQEQRLAQSALKSDVAYAERWRHISPIHIKEIDATDAALTDRGFQYFLQCRDIEKLKLNFCDYFGDDALDVLAQGRAVKSLKHLEICFNTWITERAVIKNLTRFRSLQRLHLYFLPMVATKRTAVLRQLKAALPRCKVTFPEVYFISMGYETEEEILVHKRFMKQQRNFYQRWMESEEWMPSIRRKDNDI